MAQVDQTKLEQLRARYRTAKGGQIHDPHFAKVASMQFKDGDKRAWPFAEAASFLSAPYRPDLKADPAFGGLDAILVGVPMDLGVTNRAGCRLGPRAVRSIERVGTYEHVLRVAPFATLKVADIGDVPMQSRFDLARCHADIEAFYHTVRKAGVIPLSVGGDHSISLPILLALGAERPLGMVHIDAHCDTSGEYEGSRFHHGGPFRQAVLDGVLDPERTIQIGIRGGSEWLWEFSTESGMTVLHAEDVARMGTAAVIAEARRVVGDQPFYLSFDIDSLDPAFAPGTGTPEVGGLSTLDALAIVRGLAGLPIAGADVVEVAPQYDSTSNTAQAAANVLFAALGLVAIAKGAVPGG